MRKWLFAVLLLVLPLVAVPILGQVAGPVAQDQTHGAAAYEVVSIKPDTKSENRGSGWRTLPDGLQASNVPLQWLVYNAYGIIMDSQVSGLPGWAESERYDIDAKLDAETAEAWKKLPFDERQKQERPMLQALLADRCQFKAHSVTKELPVYDLVIAKGGLKMKEAPPDEKGYMMVSGGSNSRIDAHAFPVKALVNNLPQRVGRMVIDKTGLGDKKFDFALKWTPYDALAADSTADAGPSIFTALEELGLKLVSDKAPVNVLVIDHMERPSPN